MTPHTDTDLTWLDGLLLEYGGYCLAHGSTYNSSFAKIHAAIANKLESVELEAEQRGAKKAASMRGFIRFTEKGKPGRKRKVCSACGASTTQSKAHLSKAEGNKR